VLTDDLSRTYSLNSFPLQRSGIQYRGNANLVDGNRDTSWGDYRDWRIEFVDTNDENGNGIPDLSDPEMTLEFTQAVFTNAEPSATATLRVRRTGWTNGTVTVQYATTDGTAVAPGDYLANSGTLTFGPGVTNQNISITVSNDTLAESNETLTVALSNPSVGGLIGAQTNATLLITDNDLGGMISFGAATYTVSETNTVATLMVTRTNGMASAVSVQYATSDGTATAGSDYIANSGTLTFGANVTNQTISIALLPDTVVESNETFQVTLFNALGGASLDNQTNATVTISNDDNGGTIAFSAATYSESETNAVATILVRRTGTALASGVTVDYRTTTDGTAVPGNDYTPVNNALMFGAGVTNLSFTVPLSNDLLPDGNRTVSLVLSNATGGATLGAQSAAVLTLLDDEQTLEFTRAVFTNAEWSTTATLSVRRMGPTNGTVTVQFATADGTAMAPGDYLANSGTLTFGPGVTNQTISITVSNDTLAEINETLTVALANPSMGGLIGVQTNATLLITDNDLGGVISFGAATYTFSETNTVATLLVTRTNGMASAVTMQYATSDGTATAGSDYTATNGVVTFGAGVTNQSINITLNPDTQYESNETFQVTLFNALGGASLGNQTNATVTINNDDNGGTIAFSASSYSASETNSLATIYVRRTGMALASAVTVDYATTGDGTAMPGSDYTPVDNTLTFGAGVTNLSFTVPILNDALPDGNRTVSLVLSNATGGAVLGSPSTAVLTILDDEQTLEFTQVAWTNAESSATATLTVTRNGPTNGTVTVDFATSDGTAVAPGDYTATNGVLTFASGVTSRTISIKVNNDTLVESNETLTVTLSNPGPGGLLGGQHTATLVITDNDLGGVIFFGAAAYTVSETNTVATLLVTRTNGMASAVTVQYATSDGTATAGSDYTAKTDTLTFGADVTNQTISITLLPDTVVESNEFFQVTLFDAQGRASLGSQTNATVTINNDDNGGTIAFSAATYTFSETNTLATIYVKRTGTNLASEVRVNYATTTNGTAVVVTDYTPVSNTLTFGAGVTNLSFTVPLFDDVLSDGSRTVELVLSNAMGGASLGSPSTALLTLLDNEQTLEFTQAVFTNAESSTTATLSVRRTGPNSGTVTVQYVTSDGIAVAPGDYLANSGTLTFGPGATNQTISITISNDTLAEVSENFQVTLFNALGGASMGSATNATVLITDNDFGGVIQFSSLAYSNSESGGTVTLAVTRTNGMASGVTVQYATHDGTAVAPGDYLANSGTLAFAAGVTNQTISITLSNDAADEVNEMFQVALSNPQGGASLGSVSNTTVTIIEQMVRVTFVGTNTVAQGSWKGVYGADGYEVITHAVNYPSYATVAVSALSTHVWAASTAEVRALQKVGETTDRVAGCWYSTGSFTVDLNLTDGRTHRVALYFLDWNTGRNQKVEILNQATSAVLDTRTVSSFANGRYFVWDIRGHVLVRVTNQGGLNAVLSGLFFDPPFTASRIINLSGDLAFGNVAINTTSQRMLTITNSGNSVLNISGIAYPLGFDGAFSGDIPAGGATNVTVTFAPVAVTNYAGTVTVNCNLTSGTNSLAISGTGITPYDAWLADHFSSEELANPAISGAMADPDHDGIPNLMEYALNLDPKAASGGDLPKQGIQGGYLTLTYRQNKQASDVIFIPEACANLCNFSWGTNGLTEVSRVNCNTWWSVTVQDSVPMSNATNRFMRLKVTKP